MNDIIICMYKHPRAWTNTHDGGDDCDNNYEDEDGNGDRDVNEANAN